MIKKSKRGISPVIATVLLIAMVLIIGTIIFLWANDWFKGNQIKFGGAIDSACGNVYISVSQNADETLSLDNTGDVSVVGLEILAEEGDGGQTRFYCGALNDILFAGGSSEVDLYDCLDKNDDGADGLEVVSVFPMLLDDNEDYDKLYTCDEEFIVG